jgi:hypothetical protein
VPEQPEPRDPDVTPLSPPHVGREESRGHQAEAGRRGSVGARAPDLPDDLACGYVCRGFADCFLEAAGSGTCTLCDSAERIRPECRPRFEMGEACLKAFGPPRCQDPQRFGFQFVSLCGFPVGTEERSCFQDGGR